MIRWETHRNADYGELLERQRAIFNAMVADSREGRPTDEETVMLVEHTPVYTLGRHADAANIVDEEYMRSRGADVYRVERGGDVTYHGPGQLVVYPIIDIGRRNIGVKEYVARLEEAVIRTIAEYGIKGERVEGATGVWIGCGTPAERKICAIGIKCSRFITMHGIALNVATDLRWFSAINPCGFIDKGVTSISAETGTAIAWEDAAHRFQAHFIELLG